MGSRRVAHLGPAGWFRNAWKREVAWAEAAEETGADIAKGSATEGNRVMRGSSGQSDEK
jgi:hypothetical protein